jgi:hypothetical protein
LYPLRNNAKPVKMPNPMPTSFLCSVAFISEIDFGKLKFENPLKFQLLLFQLLLKLKDLKPLMID